MLSRQNFSGRITELNDTEYNIRVDLQGCILRVFDSTGGLVAEYPVIVGRRTSLGHKNFQGDCRTPRGVYRVCTLNRQSRFTLFFGLSYPGPGDAREALRQGIISGEEFESIIQAHRACRRPPWDTPLGGEIGIHGGGIEREGTRGCVGMRDEDVLELARYVKMGTPVELFYRGRAGQS